MKNKVCITCREGAIGISPSVGGFESGVYCHSKKCAEYQDTLTGDKEYAEEFEKNGFIHMFRLECVTNDIECPCWRSRTGEEVMADVCP